MKFCEIEEKLETVSNLQELFDLWIQAHTVDDEWYLNTEQGIIQDSFIEDGYICEDINNYNGILFILLEANEKDYGINNRKNVSLYRSSQIPFYSGYVNEDENEKDTIPKLKEKLGRIAYYIENGEVAEENDFKASLGRSAFMNPNKRGGGKHPDTKILYKYFNKYKRFIQKQIELINPNYVVCIGSYKYLNNLEIVNNKFLDMWHTAYSMSRRKRTHKYNLQDSNVDLYMEEFVNRYNNKFKS